MKQERKKDDDEVTKVRFDLEELLVYYEFDFNEVWEGLSHDFNCTPQSLRSHWADYSNSLETFEELE